MKYNEFRALNAILENNGASIEDFKEDDFLFEADDKLEDTGGDKLKRAASPRFAAARRKITNNAKKYLKTGNEKLIDKYTASYLENLKIITNKAASLKKDGRNPEEIIAELQNIGKESLSLNKKRWAQVESGLDDIEAGVSKRVEQLKSNDKLSPKSKLKLDIYWSLLKAQVKSKLYNNIIQKQQSFIEEVAADNPELKSFMTKISGGENLNVEMEKLKNQAADEKRKYQDANKQPDEESTDGAETTETKIDPQIGEKYKVTTKNGEAVVEIIEIGKEGGDVGAGMVKVKDVNNKVHPISIKKLTNKIEATSTPEQSNPATSEA